MNNRHFTRVLFIVFVLWCGVCCAGVLEIVTRGPYLQNAGPSRVTVRWRTNAATDSRVSYGPTAAALTVNVDDAAVSTEHEVALLGLDPNTTYFYSIGSTGGVLAGDASFTFKTPPVAGTVQPVRMWVLGDAGTAGASQTAVRNGFTAFNGGARTDVWLMLGDNAYNTGTDAEYQAAVFNMYSAQLRNTLLWSTIGNHETAQSRNPVVPVPYFDIFTLPTNAEGGGLASGTEKYYSFDYANVHFICLDAMTSSNLPGGAMAQWLQADLGNTSQKWIVAFWHHPPYTKGSHDSDAEGDLIAMRQNILPILEEGGVDLVLCGHSHAYERSMLIDGHYGFSNTLTPAMVLDAGSGSPAYHKPAGISSNKGAVYIVGGTSGQISSWTGGSTADVNPTPHPVMFTSLRRLGSVVLDVNGNRMDVKFVSSTGSVDDAFTILKDILPEPTVIAAAGEGVSGEAVGTTFRTFGVPSINDDGEVAFLANLTTPAGTVSAVLAGSPAEVVARKGDTQTGIAGAAFASFGDPLLNGAGEVAFLGRVKGVGITAAQDEGLWSNRGGSLALIAREGAEPPGVAGGAWKAITSAVFGDGLLAFTATLTIGTGGVSSLDDTGLWIADDTGTTVALREGGSLALAGGVKVVRSFVALTTGNIGPGHGYRPGFTSVVARVNFMDATQSVLAFTPMGFTEIANGGSDAPGYTAGSKFTTFGVPTPTETGSVLLGKTKSGTGNVTTANNSAIFIRDGANLVRSFTKSESASAADAAAVFSSFKDPVAASGRRAAVLATIKGGAVTALDDTGIWWRADTSPPRLAAREGMAAPGVGTVGDPGLFKSFASLAFPEGPLAGPLFVAKLQAGLPGPGGVLTTDDLGLWGVDSFGSTRLLLREGQGLAGKTVRGFTVLSAVSRSRAQTRSFNAVQQIISRVVFSDLTQALVVSELP